MQAVEATGQITERRSRRAVAMPAPDRIVARIGALGDAGDAGDTLAEAWDDLARDAAEPNAFAERWFVMAGVRHLPHPPGLRLIEIWDEAVLIGLLPMTIAPRYGRMPVPHVSNWLHHHAFLGTPLVRRGREQAFWSAVLRALDAAHWARGLLHVNGLVEDGPVHRGLIAAAGAAGRPCDIVHRLARAQLDAGLDPEAYYEAHVRKKKRKELKRLAARLAELGEVKTRWLTDPAEVQGWCDDFLALERSGWKGAAGSALGSQPDTAAFFCDMLAGAHAAGRLDMVRIDLDGQAVAMLVNFITPPGAFSFKIAFDEDHARFSPGVLVQIENLQMLNRGEVAWMDSCAAENHPMIDSLWGGRRTIVRRHRAAGGAAAPRHLPGVPRGRGWHGPPAPVARAPGGAEVSGGIDRAAFAGLYPETPGLLRHDLAGHPAFELDALVRLAQRMRPQDVEQNVGDLPIGIDPAAVRHNGLSVVDTIRSIEQCGAWMVLKFVEQDAEYRALMGGLLDALVPAVAPKTGAMLKREAFIFISSPGAVTPFHFDPEHNILLQLRGDKVMTLFPAADEAVASGPVHEAFHMGGHRNLPFDPANAAKGRPFALAPGDAIYVPVKAPHWVRNGDAPSVSFSITWRSEWSYHEADARGLNALLRKAGLSPAAPKRYPAQNMAKSVAYRAIAKARRLATRG